MTLRAEALTRSYGKTQVLKGVSFTVSPGQVLGLLGVNGCGKSTTLKIVSGVLAASSGTLHLGDRPLTRSDVGYVPDVAGLFTRLTGNEHMRLAARLVGASSGEAADLMDILGLSAVAHVQAGSYSHGQSRRLSTAMALLGSPPVLAVDEPFDGVDGDGVEVMKNLIADRAHSGACVVVTTHLPAAASVCTDVQVIASGVATPAVPSAEILSAYPSWHEAWPHLMRAHA